MIFHIHKIRLWATDKINFEYLEPVFTVLWCSAETYAAGQASIAALQAELEKCRKDTQVTEDESSITSKQTQLSEHQQVMYLSH